MGWIKALWRSALLRLGSYFLFAFAVLFGIWVQWGNWPEPVNEGKLDKADLIVVLGGGAVERPRKTWELFEKGVAPTILITGDGDIIYNQLRGVGIPAHDMIHETAAHSTWENALFSGKFPAFQRAKKIVLVTTWFHGPRAEAVFEKQFPQKTFVVASESPQYPLNQWVNDYRRRERYAIIYYKIFHGIELGRIK